MLIAFPYYSQCALVFTKFEGFGSLKQLSHKHKTFCMDERKWWTKGITVETPPKCVKAEVAIDPPN